MNRLERLQAILIQLQSKRILKAQEIADRFGISLRTVYRDVKSLEESGVPIGAEAGTGYWLMDSFNLPPVMFTNQEASALLIGNEFVSQLVDSQTKQQYQSALTKVKAVLRSSGKEHLESLEGKVHVAKYSFDHIAPENLHLEIVKEALSKSLCLKINYHARYNSQTSERLIEPIGIVYYSMEWHLIAFCRLRKSYRDFRLDRIEKIKIVAIDFFPEKRLTLQQYLEKEMTEMKLEQVQIIFHPEDNATVQSVSHWFGNFCTFDQNGTLVTQFEVIDMEMLTGWLLSFTKGVKVLKPQRLQKCLVEKVKMLAKNYS